MWSTKSFAFLILATLLLLRSSHGQQPDAGSPVRVSSSNQDKVEVWAAPATGHTTRLTYTDNQKLTFNAVSPFMQEERKILNVGQTRVLFEDLVVEDTNQKGESGMQRRRAIIARNDWMKMVFNTPVRVSIRFTNLSFVRISVSYYVNGEAPWNQEDFFVRNAPNQNAIVDITGKIASNGIKEIKITSLFGDVGIDSVIVVPESESPSVTPPVTAPVTISSSNQDKVEVWAVPATGHTTRLTYTENQKLTFNAAEPGEQIEKYRLQTGETSVRFEELVVEETNQSVESGLQRRQAIIISGRWMKMLFDTPVSVSILLTNLSVAEISVSYYVDGQTLSYEEDFTISSETNQNAIVDITGKIASNGIRAIRIKPKGGNVGIDSLIVVPV